jgi:hypothetical protein
MTTATIDDHQDAPASGATTTGPKVGRPAIGVQVERVTMSVPPYLLGRMQSFADHSGYSKSDIMRQALEVYLTPRGF